MGKATWAGIAVLAIGAAVLIAGAVTDQEDLSVYGIETMVVGGAGLGIHYTRQKTKGGGR